MNNATTNKASLLMRMTPKTLASHALVLLLAAVLWPSASARAERYGFTLVGPNLAQNPTTLATIRLTGAGGFDTDSGAVSGSGAFTEYDSNGKVITRGTWAATSFESFHSDGGLNPGTQGGVLQIRITLYPKRGTPVTDQLMTVVCPFEEDEGVFHEDEDGTTVGDFSEIVQGLTVFQWITRP